VKKRIREYGYTKAVVRLSERWIYSTNAVVGGRGEVVAVRGLENEGVSIPFSNSDFVRDVGAIIHRR
jgi:hypothetical protein